MSLGSADGCAAVRYASSVAVSRLVIGMVLPAPFFESRIRSVPAPVSTSEMVSFSASEIRSPVP